VVAVARATFLALVLRAPVLAVARAAVLALALPAPVVAEARAAVLAPALPAPVLAGLLGLDLGFAGLLGARGFSVGANSSMGSELLCNKKMLCPLLLIRGFLGLFSG
jgi:hypothetical protein